MAVGEGVVDEVKFPPIFVNHEAGEIPHWTGSAHVQFIDDGYDPQLFEALSDGQLIFGSEGTLTGGHLPRFEITNQQKQRIMEGLNPNIAGYGRDAYEAYTDYINEAGRDIDRLAFAGAAYPSGVSGIEVFSEAAQVALDKDDPEVAKKFIDSVVQALSGGKSMGRDSLRAGPLSDGLLGSVSRLARYHMASLERSALTAPDKSRWGSFAADEILSPYTAMLIGAMDEMGVDMKDDIAKIGSELDDVAKEATETSTAPSHLYARVTQGLAAKWVELGWGIKEVDWLTVEELAGDYARWGAIATAETQGD